MATPGPRTAHYLDRAAGNLLRLARMKTGVTQRQVASDAGVSRSTVSRVEAHTMQPTYAMLQRLIIATGLEIRPHLETYDDHDDVLDNLAALDPARAERDRLEAERLDRALAAAPVVARSS